jgi:hypothetical protein
VCYAPEFETIDELQEKINERRYIVAAKCKKYEKMKFGTIAYDVRKSRNYGLRDKLKKTPKKVDLKDVEHKQAAPEQTKPIEENPVFDKPELPPDWVQESLTGEKSYDESVKEIRAHLKTTIVSFGYWKLYFLFKLYKLYTVYFKLLSRLNKKLSMMSRKKGSVLICKMKTLILKYYMLSTKHSV